MKKSIKIFSLLFFVFTAMSFTMQVNAASATFSVKASASTVAVGNNVTVTVTLSSGTALGSWNFTIGYDTSKLKLVSSTAERDQTSAGVVDSANQKSVSYKYTFKALKSGTTNVNISDALVYDFNDEKMSLSKGSVNINLKTWQQIEASYSTNANLKSLSIDGGELNPDISLNPVFNKDTLEYTVELEPDTTQIKVGATKEDSTASISGTGDINVSEGSNRIEIVVTAQKGNTKTYVINAIVKELEPITEVIEGVTYTVVRKSENLVKPYSYTEDTVIIQEFEVPAFYSSITGYKLVGLKDEAGITKLFIYDESKDTYKYYQELSLGKVILAPLSIPEDKIIKDYTKSLVTINEEQVESLINDEFGITLVYGKNVETGKTLFYVYDKNENTLQRYDEDVFAKIDKKLELYTYIILGLGGFIVLLIIILIVFISKSKKRLKDRKEEMRQEIIEKEEMAKLEEINKQKKKQRDKELKKKQKELEVFEKQVKEKLESEEKKTKKHNKKKKNIVQEDQFEDTNHMKEDLAGLPEFELETKNEEQSTKKKKNKHNEDDDMFLL